MSKDLEILLTLRLEPHHRMTGRTRHTVMGKPLERPTLLKIVRLGVANEYHLFFCYSSGQEMTDTSHDSIHSAMDQAAFEFDVARAEWERACRGTK